MAKKILIADDEEDIKLIVQMHLEQSGYEIVTAYDGLDAIDKAKTERPDAILLDIMMPIIDGFEVCKRLKAESETRDIPIIMFSAAAQNESKNRAFDAGAIEYIVKPFDPAILDEKFKAVFEGQES